MSGISISQLRNEFTTKLTRIPKFINSTDHLHYILWRTMMECNDIVLRLVIDRVLTEKRLIKIINDFGELIEAIIDNTPPDIHLHISAYYVVNLELMITRSQEEEHYEVCSNLKKFLDYYFTTTPVNNE